MVITRVEPEEVLERWQFDIQCENTGKDAATDDKQAPRFAYQYFWRINWW